MTVGFVKPSVQADSWILRSRRLLSWILGSWGLLGWFLSPAPPSQRARSATAERESYQAIFLEEKREGGAMKSLSPAPP